MASDDHEDFSDVSNLIKSVEIHHSPMKTLKDFFEVPDRELQKYYKNACTLLQQKDYQDAADAFLFLATIDPDCFNYWLNLGVSEQQKGEYEEALAAYANAILIELDNPTPHLHASECYVALGKLSQAIDSLKMAMECQCESVESTTVKSHMLDLTKLIKECKDKNKQQQT